MSNNGDNGRLSVSGADAPLVSVAIPCYNYGHYLGQAIDSVLAQDYPRIECIVIDDGSTDNSHDVAAAYGEKVRYVYKDNAGLSAARNTGIKAARGNYIAFLDADDMLLPQMVSTCMAKLAELGDSYAAVACRYQRVDSDGVPVDNYAKGRPIHGELTADDLILCNRFPADGIVVRTSVFADCGEFDTHLTSSEDRDMWIRIASTRSIWLLDAALVQVRSHSGSMSCNSGRMRANMRRVLDKARGMDGAPEGVAFWSAAYAFCDYQVAWMYNEEGRGLRALILLGWSVLRHPLFLDPGSFENKPLFRLRAVRHFLMRMAGGGG